MKLNHKGLEAAIDAAVKDAPDGGIELDIGAAITAYLQAVGPEPVAAGFAETLNFYISEAEDGICRVPRQKLVEIRTALRSALVATPPAGGDDWTVDDTLTAREILDYLGIGSDASLEPYADRRRDAVAKIIQKRIVATPPADSGAPPCWWIDHGSHGQITQREDEASRAIAEGKRVVRYTASIATPPAERAVEAQIREVANLAFDALFNTAGASLARSVQQKILALAAKPAVKDDETVVETVKRWPERGDKMRFLGRNGYDQELERARRAFAIDTDYTVSRIEIGSWSSNLYFEEVEGSWNSVMFDFAPATLAAKDGRS